MKKKIVVWSILISLLTMSMSSMLVYQTSNAAGVIGKSGSIPAGGSTGAGGGIASEPSFRVGLISEEFRTPIKTDKLEEINPQIINHYVNHFPNMAYSIIFSPEEVYTSNSVVAWYNDSNGDLQYLADDLASYKHRKMYESNLDDTDSLYYNDLYAMANTAEIDFRRDFADGKWKVALSKVANNVDASMRLWSYILGDWDKPGEDSIETKLILYTRYTPADAATPENRLKNQIGYLSLMMSLYSLSPPNQQLFYEREIERYIKGDQSILTHPPLVAIDTVIRAYIPGELGATRMFVSSTHYASYIGGLTPLNSLFNEKALTFPVLENKTYEPNHYKKVISNLVKNSMEQLPDRKRITSYRGDAYRNNAFAWAMGLVFGNHYLHTSTGTPEWKPSSIQNGIMEYLTFHGEHKGFFIVNADNIIVPKENPTGGFRIKSSHAETEILEEGSTVIGEQLIVTITGDLQNEEETTFIGILGDTIFKPGYPKIKIDLKVSGAINNQADTGALFSTSDILKGNNTWISLEPDVFLDFMLSNKTINYIHNLSTQPIADNSNQQYKYTANISVKLNEGMDEFQLEGRPSTDSTTFVNPELPDPALFGKYTSEFKGWSEIKSGSPGNEKFEAMSGTPTTRSLYFISGGSEFIADIETRYYENETSERTYRSYFTGVPSEFKMSDRAGSVSVGGTTFNGHSGGSYTKTWSGSIPNKATSKTVSGSGNVSATCTAIPDMNAYNASLTQAQAYASLVNGTTVSFTAASDGVNRTYNSWGASPSSSKSLPKTTSKSNSAWHTEYTHHPAEGTPGEPGYKEAYTTSIQVADPVSVTANPSGAGSYTIKVTFALPAHTLCGPEHEHDLPMIEDTFTQKIEYDIQKIEKVNIWKIDRSHVDGMTRLIGTDEVTALVKKGDPNLFYNIANNENSSSGRLRYSLESSQHDTVVWNEGPRSNKSDGKGRNTTNGSGGSGHSATYATGILYTNGSYGNIENYHTANSDTKDKSTSEYAKFDERRKLQNTATVISDFVILQTSSGDQSLIYFDKDSTPKQTQKNFDSIENTKEEMWDNNPESASNWTPNEINVGSYSGEYWSINSKYEGNGNNHITTTKLDSDHTISRPSRPNNLQLAKLNLNVIDTIPNGEYITGKSSIYYKPILSYGGDSTAYTNSTDVRYGRSGLVLETSYSDTHTKVNDIIIHNPVSTENALVLPVDASFDQRTASTSILGGNLQEDSVELITKLKETHPAQEYIYNGGAEILINGKPEGWQTYTPNLDGVEFRTWAASGNHEANNDYFEIITPKYGNRFAKYYQEVNIFPNKQYTLKGELHTYRTKGYFQVDALDSGGNVLDSWQSTHVNNQAGWNEWTINFTAPASADKVRVNIVSSGSVGSDGNHEAVYVSDVSLTEVGGETSDFVGQSYTIETIMEIPNPIYVTPYTIPNPMYLAEHQEPNPDYIPEQAQPAEVKTLEYTGSPQTFKAPIAGVYTLEAWGSAGGYSTYGKGGYIKGTIELEKDDVLYVYVGSAGTENIGGYNGGGDSKYGSLNDNGAGGGATDFRLINGDWKDSAGLNSRILVAGGGGGGRRDGGDGGYPNGTTDEGASQTSGYAFGYGAGVYRSDDNPGGGGGWYGGNYRQDRYGGGGSGYILTTTSHKPTGYTPTSKHYMNLVSHSTGVRNGNGLAKITVPAVNIPAVGSPTRTVPASGGSPTILVNNTNYIPAVVTHHPTIIVTPAQGVPILTNLAPTIISNVIIDKAVTMPPDDWYETVAVTIEANPNVIIPGVGPTDAGDMIVLGKEFQIYYPNKGDFYGNGAKGIAETTSKRGNGFKDNMDTTEWTASKTVKFDFNVIYENRMYTSGVEIDLPVDEEIYDFKLPIANKEAVSAEVQFLSIANNGTLKDNTRPSNSKRYSSKNAKHSAVKEYNIDLIGRIGNLIIEDTGDFRFSNLFKNSLTPTQWLIKSIVPEVDITSQNRIVSTATDILGETISSDTNYLNTFGALGVFDRNPMSFPLTPSSNNIPALRKQPLRIGYPLLLDIQTVGNYHSGMQVIPYYYSLNLTTGAIEPVDVYMRLNSKYVPINLNENATAGWDINSVYHYPIDLDWDSEKGRRNYSTEEQDITEFVKANTYFVNNHETETEINIPIGDNYTYGIAQILQLSDRNRTYIGSSKTNNIDFNPGDIIDEYDYNSQAQRWHFSVQLPSSSIFVPKGRTPNQDDINTVMSNTTVIILALDIKSIGDTYVLDYTHPEGNRNVSIAGSTYELTSIPQAVVAVYSSEKSSADDLDTSGSH